MAKPTNSRLHEGAVLQGFLMGVVVGALVWFWRAPRSGEETRARLRAAPRELRDKLDATEAVHQSIAQGKALAQQRAALPPTTPAAPR